MLFQDLIIQHHLNSILLLFLPQLTKLFPDSILLTFSSFLFFSDSSFSFYLLNHLIFQPILQFLPPSFPVAISPINYPLINIINQII